MTQKNIKTEIQNYLNFLSSQPKGFVYKGEKIKSQKKDLLESLYSTYKNCQKCPLSNQGRTQVVFGQGNANTKLMFIGEGPGREEDIQGIPFIGKAGQLLTKIIQAMKIKRNDIYLSNVSRLCNFS